LGVTLKVSAEPAGMSTLPTPNNLTVILLLSLLLKDSIATLHFSFEHDIAMMQSRNRGMISFEIVFICWLFLMLRLLFLI
jgi:hypothetical protein